MLALVGGNVAAHDLEDKSNHVVVTNHLILSDRQGNVQPL